MNIGFQNSPSGLELVSAFRALYSSAKNWSAIRFCLNTVVMVIVYFVYLAFSEGWFKLPQHDYSWILSVYSILILLIDYFFITPRIEWKVSTASRIQQEFDCKVFNWQWDEHLFGAKIADETITSWGKGYQQDLDAVQNWYEPSVGQVPKQFGVVLCQNMCVWWENELRILYNFLIVLFGFFLAAFCVVYAGGIGLDVQKLFSLVVAPMIPYIFFTLSTCRVNKKSINQYKDLQGKLIATIELFLETKQAPANIMKILLGTQLVIMHHRFDAPLIPDFFYTWFKPSKAADTKSSISKHVNRYLGR